MWPWEECLAHDTFVVVVRGGTIEGAFLAWPDESPVAWVRAAALDNALHINAWLSLSLPAVLASLRGAGCQALAWMDHAGWAGMHLQSHGFVALKDVVTFSKLDRSLPSVGAADICTRPASDADIPAVVAVDRVAFAPHWWQGTDTIRRRAAASAHFRVAQAEGETVGYAEGELRPPIAHLNRIAVVPSHQGRGIGTSLLREALCAFWQQGAEWVTLNTQSDNRISQRLYQRFGFEATGDSATVWELRIR
jgi:GNAT superfamily N-acetyltransferase